MDLLEECGGRFLNMCNGNVVSRSSFIAGAKYQAERMYSEEEVIELLEYTRENFYDTGIKWHEEPYKDLTSKELLEQFKKK